MAGRGTLRLALRDVRNQPIEDTVEIAFRRMTDGSLLRRPFRRRFSATDPAKQQLKFGLPAIPEEWALRCEVDPDKFHRRSAAAFSLTEGEEVSRSLTVVRTPEHWTPSFTLWADLPSRFRKNQQPAVVLIP